MSTKLKLFDSDDEDSDPENCRLTINEQYAERYSAWKEKEELQKLKEKYGDLSDDSDTSEDEEEVNWNAEFDKEWLRVYSAVKFKDKDIYNTDIQFVRDEAEEENEEEKEVGDKDSHRDSSESEESEKEEIPKKKKHKDDGPLTIRDHERRLITDRKGVLSESEDEEEMMIQTQGPGYHAEQEAIRKSIKKAMADMSSSDEEGDILTHRIKSEKEKREEEEEYLQFLKGEKEAEQLKSRDKEIAKELVPLRTFYSQPEEGEDEAKKVVWNTLICRGAFKEKSDSADEELIEEESELREMEEEEEEFEHTYNFRFEEPDKNFIKQYKRNPEDSVRQEVNKRAQKRKEVQERKKMAMEERREEIRRLKKLKKKELENRLQLLMKECPSGVDFSPDDLKGDFNPKAYDKMMQEKFENMSDDDEDEEKPDLADLEDVLSIDSYEDIFEERDRSVADSSQREEEEEEEEEEEDDGNAGTKGAQTKQANKSKLSVDAGFDPSWIPDMSRSSKKSRRRRKSKFQQALDMEKPLFSQVYEKYKTSDTPWEDYVQEYYKLDYKEHGFHYHNVVANDYGLQPEEILWLPTRELNSWVSMKKVVEQKSESEEMYDKRKFQSAKMQRKIINVLPSLKKIEDEESRYEDIRPSVLRQQKMAQLAAEDSDMSESEQPTEEDFGSQLQTSSQQSPKKKRKADSVESVGQEVLPPKKKKKFKAGGSGLLLNNGQEMNSASETNCQGKEGEKKKKKKKKLGTDKAKASQENGLRIKKKKKREKQAEIHSEVEKTENMNSKNSQVLEKKKRNAKVSAEISDQQEPPKKKKKKQTAEGEEQPRTLKKGGKKKLKGKKKQKRRDDGTPKVRGYIAKEKIQESRLAAFHIDPRKFKYTKDRIVPLQPDQD